MPDPTPADVLGAYYGSEGFPLPDVDPRPDALSAADVLRAFGHVLAPGLVAPPAVLPTAPRTVEQAFGEPRAKTSRDYATELSAGKTNIDPLETALGVAGGSPATFIGPGARTFPKAALAEANRLFAAGKTAEEVRQATGINLNAAGQPQFEISDKSMTVDMPRVLKAIQNKEETVPAGDIFKNWGTFEAYPEMAKWPVKFNDPMFGQYTGEQKVLGAIDMGTSPPALLLNPKQLTSAQDIRSFGAHELGGHGVSKIEGYPSGGGFETPVVVAAAERSTKQRLSEARRTINEVMDARDQYVQTMVSGGDRRPVQAIQREFFDAQPELTDRAAAAIGEEGKHGRGRMLLEERFKHYESLAGEEQARNIQKRLDLEQPQLKATPPEATQDRPYAEQIIHYGPYIKKPALPLEGQGAFEFSAEPKSFTERMAEAQDVAFRRAQRGQPTGDYGLGTARRTAPDAPKGSFEDLAARQQAGLKADQERIINEYRAATGQPPKGVSEPLLAPGERPEDFQFSMSPKEAETRIRQLQYDRSQARKRGEDVEGEAYAPVRNEINRLRAQARPEDIQFSTAPITGAKVVQEGRDALIKGANATAEFAKRNNFSDAQIKALIDDNFSSPKYRAKTYADYLSAKSGRPEDMQFDIERLGPSGAVTRGVESVRDAPYALPAANANIPGMGQRGGQLPTPEVLWPPSPYDLAAAGQAASRRSPTRAEVLSGYTNTTANPLADLPRRGNVTGIRPDVEFQVEKLPPEPYDFLTGARPDAPFPQYADVYPATRRPTYLPKTSGEGTYPAKTLTQEGEAVAAAREKIIEDMRREGYQPFFDPSQRFPADFAAQPGPHLDTAAALAKKPETIAAHTKEIDTPQTRANLRAGYSRGLDLPESQNWYMLGQVERKMIEDLGPEAGRKAFQDLATSMAGTTTGMSPNQNLIMGKYLDYLRATGQPMPSASHQTPVAVGGQRTMPNVEAYNEIYSGGGYPSMTLQNPKRVDFAQALMGNPRAFTVDEQMGHGMIGKDVPQKGTYGIVTQLGREEAARAGVDPQNYQDVAWAGFKKMLEEQGRAKKGFRPYGEGEGYQGKPMISEVNDMIERIHRLTGRPRAEVWRKVFIENSIPVYGVGGLTLGSVLMGQQMREPAAQ